MGYYESSKYHNTNNHLHFTKLQLYTATFTKVYTLKNALRTQHKAILRLSI